MEQSIEEAWAKARVIFKNRTLTLTGPELGKARRQARPFVKLVSKSFVDALADQVLRPPKVRKHDITVALPGWGSDLVLRYPRPPAVAKRTTRQRFDYFYMSLPTGDAKLQLRFALGEGDTRRDAWDIIQWGLFSWGTKERIDNNAVPVLRAIKERLPDLQLDPRESVTGVLGGSAQLGSIIEYTEFGAHVQASVEMVAEDLRRLLDAVQEYQDR